MRMFLFLAVTGVLTWSFGVTPSVHGETDDPATNKPVLLTLVVPVDAQVWFDDMTTTQAGEVRQFESPPVATGRDYSYHLRVRFTENGRAVEEKRKVSVRAGDALTVRFGKAARSANVQSDYYYPPTASQPAAPGGPNRNVYPGYSNDSYPSYNSGSSSGGSGAPAWVPDQSENRRWGPTRD